MLKKFFVCLLYFFINFSFNKYNLLTLFHQSLLLSSQSIVQHLQHLQHLQQFNLNYTYISHVYRSYGLFVVDVDVVYTWEKAMIDTATQPPIKTRNNNKQSTSNINHFIGRTDGHIDRQLWYVRFWFKMKFHREK